MSPDVFLKGEVTYFRSNRAGFHTIVAATGKAATSAWAGGGDGQQQSGVEYAEEKLVKQRRRVARGEAYHAAQSKLFAALDR